VWPEAETEKAMLKNRAQALQAELAQLNERLTKLDAAKAGE
jgi:prefoldin subunit 5